MSAPAVFFDKDGTLVENVPYNVDPARLRLAPFAGEAVARVHAAGFRIVVVSNQPGVALGRFGERALLGVGARLREELEAAGVPLDGFYWCPHHPDGIVARYAYSCSCRKPMSGMLLRAARDLDIDLASSWMVGDILDDIEAGRRAGCRTVLLDVGHETEWTIGPLRRPHAVAPNLAIAAEAICAVPDDNGALAEKGADAFSRSGRDQNL